GEMLARYLRMIQVKRGAYHGRMLTIRRDGLRAVACILDCHPDQLPARIDSLGSCLVRLDCVTTPSGAAAPTGELSGVHVDVPLRAARCDYCPFATRTDRHPLQGAYLEACRPDAERHVAGGMPPATSVFVGGGTPSLVPPRDLVAVVEAIPTRPGCE